MSLAPLIYWAIALLYDLLHTGGDRGILDDGGGDVVRGAGGRHVGKLRGQITVGEFERTFYFIMSKCQNVMKRNKIERRKLSERAT